MKTLLKLVYVISLTTVLAFWLFSNGGNVFGNLSSFLISFGKLFGLLAAFSVLVQLMLMGRIKWIETVFGHDKLTKVHRKHGNFAFSFIWLHFLFILVGYSGGKLNPSKLIAQVFTFIFTFDDVAKAFIGLILFTCIVGLSITIVRSKLKYETWYYVHLLTYIAIYFAFGHQLEVGTDFVANPAFRIFWYVMYVFVTANFVSYRFIIPIVNFFKYDFKVEKTVNETQNVTSVYIGGKNLANLKVLPGQFIIVRFLAKGFWFEAHPFSISNYPNGQNLRLSIKNSGDFTAKINQLPVGTKVIIDGPHGTFTPKSAKRDKILLIAGGIGITPIRNVLEAFLIMGKEVILIYSLKNQQEYVFAGELENLQEKFPYQKEVMFTDQTTKRIDLDYLTQKVKDIKTREIYICGPKAMTLGLSQALKEFGINSSQLHYEVFEL